MTHFFKIHENKKGFTLFELSIGMTIFASLMIAILASMSYISVARQKSENRILLLQELYFFSEQLIGVVTDGGTLDYEEYWDRMTYDTQTESGHYKLPTGFGNYGSGGDMRATGGNYGGGNYLCRSGNGVRMGTGGCATNTNLNDKGTLFTGKYQRYGEYALQYMDYNGNADSDLGDEDGDGKIVGDEDDRDIGDGPDVVTLSQSTSFQCGISNGLITTIPDGDNNDCGPNRGGDALELWCYNNTLKLCLSGESCFPAGRIVGGVTDTMQSSYGPYSQYTQVYNNTPWRSISVGGGTIDICNYVNCSGLQCSDFTPPILKSPVKRSLTELYMINENERTRTYLRLIVRDDPNAPVGTVCTQSGNTWVGCLGNVQILRMRGLDRGMMHGGILSDTGAFDGLIDTWVCHPDWSCTGPTIGTNEVIATGSGSEWVDLFPDTINVKDISFQAFPGKNPWRSWSAADSAIDPSFVTPFIHPYVKLKLTLGFAWVKRNLQLQKTDDPTISIVTSVNLSDL